MAMSVNVLATGASGESDVTTSRVHIADAIDNNAFPESSQRAIVAPTSYAPTSWYNVKHNWTGLLHLRLKNLWYNSPFSRIKYTAVRVPQRYIFKGFFNNRYLFLHTPKFCKDLS